MKKTELFQTANLTMKYSAPAELSSARIGLMLHGWTGDENSMWVFASQLDEDWLLIAPRAPYPSQGTNLGGFSWVNQRIDHWPLFTDFLPAVELLHSDLNELSDSVGIRFNDLSVFGFSQGAAMSLVYSMVHREQVSKLALLSGFIPDSSEGYVRKGEETNPLNVFVGHGNQDQIVPVAKANEGMLLLRDAGYPIQSCISDVGHRLGSDCFKALTGFLNQR